LVLVVLVRLDSTTTVAVRQESQRSHRASVVVQAVLIPKDRWVVAVVGVVAIVVSLQVLLVKATMALGKLVAVHPLKVVAAAAATQPLQTKTARLA
jgi:hypothetical protein